MKSPQSKFKVLMLSNTYTPIVGGLERSIQTFTREIRRTGHEVWIVAPQFKNQPGKEKNVIRVPAIQKFNGTDFSLNLPIPGLVEDLFKNFRPDIVHSHHPFLMGDMAIRLSGQYRIPHIFTYHTMFEHYTSYFSLDSEVMRRFVIEHSVGFANITDQVIVPSESVGNLLLERGVTKPIAVVPTGVDTARFRQRVTGAALRKRLKIPARAFVVGYSGRLSQEKNLGFLAEAVMEFASRHSDVWFLVAGSGAEEAELKKRFEAAGLKKRLVMPGVLKDKALIQAYKAMDCFAFASLSETQGLVVTEAMAAGLPVVAIDAPGVREVVRDGKNGYLIGRAEIKSYIAALEAVYDQNASARKQMVEEALETAENLSAERCARRLLTVYQEVKRRKFVFSDPGSSPWAVLMNRARTEWEMLNKLTRATGAALKLSKQKSKEEEPTTA